MEEGVKRGAATGRFDGGRDSLGEDWDAKRLILSRASSRVLVVDFCGGDCCVDVTSEGISGSWINAQTYRCRFWKTPFGIGSRVRGSLAETPLVEVARELALSELACPEQPM